MSAHLVARLLAVARSGAIAIDAEGRVALLNDAARDLLGLPPGNPTGRPLAEVLASCPSLARLLDGALAAAADGNTLPAEKAEAAVVVGGRERAVGFTVHAARDEAGRPLGALVLLKALSQIETGVETTLARERLAAVGAMAATIAHEMRNPLAGIRLSASMLKRRLEATPAEDGLLDAIITEVRTLEQTVNRCLTYLRPVALEVTEVCVNDVVREALALTEEALVSAGSIEMRLDFAEGLPRVTGDPNRLREAVCNLVSNAIDAMREQGGTLTLATGPSSGPGVAITVADTGPGIAPDILDSIFYPFFTTKPEGSGVGLATVQKIVTGHGGGVEVQSEPGRGASFRIVLPIVRGAVVRPTGEPRRRAS